MDFDALVGSLASHPETKHQLYGSGTGSALGFRPASGEDDSRRWSKQSKTDDFSSSNAASLRSSDLFSLSHAQTLSFPSPNTESLLPERSCSSASARNTGYSSGSLNCGGMYGGLAGIRGPLTPSQWMELEHQALIYKYIAANVAVPSNLLIPIGKALDSAGLSGLPAVFLRPNASGWGAFHVGFSGGNSDPEPRRCRRTDGKKWRCGRDAVADQKYCERHINRGRHRSRKPVEGGQAGQSVAGISNNNIAATPKLVSSSTAAAEDSGAGFPNYIVKNLTSFHPSGSTQISRMLPEKDDGGGRVASCFSIPKPQMSYEASPQTGFGLVSGDKKPLTTGKSLGGEGETESRLHHFLWSGVDAQSERTQLSISTAMDASDLRWPSSAAPANEKLTLSPLRLSKDFDPIQMGLGVSNWVPIAWGSSMGGPLGEVLNHRNNNGGGECEEGGSSPTGVLQKSSFGSVSTGSAGSSPRAEKKNRVVHEGGRLCNDLLGQLL